MKGMKGGPQKKGRPRKERVASRPGLLARAAAARWRGMRACMQILMGGPLMRSRVWCETDLVRVVREGAQGGCCLLKRAQERGGGGGVLGGRAAGTQRSTWDA